MFLKEKKVSRKKIIITGASGFIGKRLIHYLSSENDYFILTRKNSKWDLAANFKVIKGSLEDLPALADKIGNLDIIIHMAAEINDESKMVSVNIEGVKSLCDFARKTETKKIIHLSSVGVNGKQFSRNETIVDENTDCTPLNEYERTKLESEWVLKEFQSVSAVELVILRPTNVFGDEHPKKVLLNLMSTMQSGKRIPCVEGAFVNYVYVNDLVNCILFSINQQMKEKVYVIGNAVLLNDFIDCIAKKGGFRDKRLKLPRFLMNFLHFMKYFGSRKLRLKIQSVSNGIIYDGNKIMTETKLKYHLEEGIEKTIEYYRNNKWLK